jgi:outer membrane biosynthesis protein TonB
MPTALDGAAARVAPASSAADATPGNSPGVLHQELPAVSRGAANTIHGRFPVVLRVTADRSGNVIDERFEFPGPSRYFAGKAYAAARQWKFAPAASAAPREWLLRFEFSRDQISARAEPAQGQ